MLLDKTIEIALRCHHCGRLEKNKLNIFEIRNDKMFVLKCSCGSVKARIKEKGNKYILLEYNCFLCDEDHRRIIDKKSFWNLETINHLKCLKSGLEIGSYGNQELIEEELNKQKEELRVLADELGLNDYQEPELLLEVFNTVHDRASHSKLYCECGNDDIDVKLYSSKIELKCRKCGSVLNISAETEAQLNELKNKDDIVIKNTNKSEHNWTDNKYKEE
ncbi:MAG: hypothetical protein K9K76_02855 [Halanaerobiales bacterium]|nr:hypothetical protein [Halanaerobiales bacterium]